MRRGALDGSGRQWIENARVTLPNFSIPLGLHDHPNVSITALVCKDFWLGGVGSSESANAVAVNATGLGFRCTGMWDAQGGEWGAVTLTLDNRSLVSFGVALQKGPEGLAIAASCSRCEIKLEFPDHWLKLTPGCAPAPALVRCDGA